MKDELLSTWCMVFGYAFLQIISAPSSRPVLKPAGSGAKTSLRTRIWCRN